MPTARERMLELSSLPSGFTARAHFLSITQTGGGPGEPVFIDRLNNIYGEEVIVLLGDIEIELEDDVIEVQAEPDYIVTLEDEFKVKP